MLIEIRSSSIEKLSYHLEVRTLEKRHSTACQVVLTTLTSKNASNEQKEAAKRVTRMVASKRRGRGKIG